MLKLPLVVSALTFLSSCGTIDQMNNQVNASTWSIMANEQAIRQSTDQIRQNRREVEGSTRALQENEQVLHSAAGT